MTQIYENDINNILNNDSIDWKKFKGSTVLVTGATGLIGMLITKTLYRLSSCKGIKCCIHALARNREKAEKVYAEEIKNPECFELIISDIREFTQYDDKVDYIIHAASETASKSFIEHPVEVTETAVIGTINLLRLAKDKRIRGMVFLSTMEVYGTPQNDEKIYENRELYTKPSVIRNSYSIGKIQCENLCASYADEYDVPVKVLRLTQTFGAGVDYSDGRVFAEFARCAIEGRDIVLKTKGDTKRNYLYTTDAVNAIFTVLLAKSSAEQGRYEDIFNGANEETYCSIREMAEIALTSYGTGKQIVRIEEKEDISKFGFAPTLHMNLDTEKLQKLGWKPQYGLKEMFERTCRDMDVRRGNANEE